MMCGRGCGPQRQGVPGTWQAAGGAASTAHQLANLPHENMLLTPEKLLLLLLQLEPKAWKQGQAMMQPMSSSQLNCSSLIAHRSQLVIQPQAVATWMWWGLWPNTRSAPASRNTLPSLQMSLSGRHLQFGPQWMNTTTAVCGEALAAAT